MATVAATREYPTTVYNILARVVVNFASDLWTGWCIYWITHMRSTIDVDDELLVVYID
jgi:hypothetical protein